MIMNREHRCGALKPSKSLKFDQNRYFDSGVNFPVLGAISMDFVGFFRVFGHHNHPNLANASETI